MSTLLASTHSGSVDYSTRLISTITTLYTFAVTENPLVWTRRQGKNKDADGRGPYYVHGAPHRQIEAGKGILASLDLLKKYGCYLFTGRVIDEEGNPVAGATLDFWHADTGGTYYFDKYELRGKVLTDSEGRFEVLSVTPGAYLGRAGHFHYIITLSQKDKIKYEDLTCQSYICKANDTKDMGTDFVNWFYWRNPPYNRMVHSWSIPSSNNGNKILDFPSLDEISESVAWDASDKEGVEGQIKAWNERLRLLEEAKGSEGGLKVIAGGFAESVLSPKGSLGLW